MVEVWCLCGLFHTVALPPPALCSRTTKRQIIRPTPRNPDICFFHSALSLSSFRPCCNSVAHVLWVWAIPSWHYTAGLASGPAVRSYPEVLLELHAERREREGKRLNWLIAPFCSVSLFFSHLWKQSRKYSPVMILQHLPWLNLSVFPINLHERLHTASIVYFSHLFPAGIHGCQQMHWRASQAAWGRAQKCQKVRASYDFWADVLLAERISAAACNPFPTTGSRTMLFGFELETSFVRCSWEMLFVLEAH